MMGAMRTCFLRAFFGAFLTFTLLMPTFVQAQALTSRINEAFRTAYGRNPDVSENQYWAGRVARGEKKTFAELLGAMYFFKAQGLTRGGVATGSSAGASKAVSTTANKTQLIVDVLPLFVKIYGNNPSNAEKA